MEAFLSGCLVVVAGCVTAVFAAGTVVILLWLAAVLSDYWRDRRS